MAQVVYSRRALSDLHRLELFLARQAPDVAEVAMLTIFDAIEVLERHPLIGRRSQGPYRELVIAYGQRGYVALYRFEPRRQIVRVLAIRHQREAGFQE